MYPAPKSNKSSRSGLFIRSGGNVGKEVLLDNMFDDKESGAELAGKIANKLSDLSTNKQHDRHVHYQDAIKMGLNIKVMEKGPELQNLVLTVHRCYMHTLSNMPVLKIIEKREAFSKLWCIIPAIRVKQMQWRDRV